MKLTRRLLLAATIITQTLIAHGQQNPLHAYLPVNAKAIINFNLPSLASKMNWQEFQELPFFEEALKDAPLHVQEFLKNPAGTGINFQSDLFIVLHPDPKNKSKSIPYLYGLLADTAKFAASVQKMTPKQKIKSLGKLKVLADKKNVIAWTPEIFVIPLSKKESIPAVSPSKKTPDTKTVALESKQLLNKYQLLLTPVTTSAISDSRFAELVRENGDIRFWMNRNTEKPKQKGKADEVLKMMNWGMMQQGNYMAGVLRFEKGKAVVQMKSYMNKTMDSLYRLYPPMHLNSNLLKKLPSGQPIALLSFGMSPEMINALLKTTGAEKIIDSLSKKSSVDPMEIIKGLNGDLTMVVIRAHEYDEKDTVTAALNGLQLFLAASVKDKARLEPLLKLLQKPKKVKKDEDGNEIKPAGPFAGLKPASFLNDSFFVISISSFAAEKFLKTTGSNETAEMAMPYISHASLFSLDMKAIINFAMQMSGKKGGNDEAMARNFDAFDRIVFYGGEYENGAALSTGELQFTDKEENSLKQLANLLETIANMGMKSMNSKSNKESHVETEERTKIDAPGADKDELPPPPPPPALNQKTKPKTQKDKN